MSSVTINAPSGNLASNTVIQKAFDVTFTLVVDDLTYYISQVVVSTYYPDGSSDNTVITLITGVGQHVVNMPLPPRGAPNYGQVFGIKVSMVLLSTVISNPAISIVANTGLGFRTLPVSWQPYVPPAYGTVEEAERQYWEGSQGSGAGNGSPAPPPAAPPGVPPDYPNSPSTGTAL